VSEELAEQTVAKHFNMHGSISRGLLDLCADLPSDGGELLVRDVYDLVKALLSTPTSAWKGGSSFDDRVGAPLHRLRTNLLQNFGDAGDLVFERILHSLPQIAGEIEFHSALGHVTTVTFITATKVSRVQPPRWAEYLLAMVVERDQRSAICGDLAEEFTIEILPKFGPRAARLWYVRQVLSSVMPVVTRKLWKGVRAVAIVRKVVNLYSLIESLFGGIWK
jgi:hypothetical protein